MAENEKLKPTTKFWPDNLLLMLIRTDDFNTTNVLRVVMSLQNCIIEKYPDLFGLINPSELKPFLDKKIFRLVKHASPNNPGVATFEFKSWKPSEIPVDHLIAVATVYGLQLGQSSKDIQRNGIIVALDADGLGFSHARQISYDVVKKLLYCMVYTSPIRIIGYVVYNSSYLMEKLYSVVKYAVPERARKDVYVLKKDLTALHALVPDKQFLPTSIGGEVPNDLAFQEDAEEAALDDLTIKNLLTDLQREFGVGKK
ncbi:alpha-tocopherol transfer protein-like [Folsomia candida]|uniref:alpha-tocopherol transfer protein-like n=1 Tax=Folsomia candida TaxID=158441 RepID=UPI0016051F97|nr:alpha-tocopherol transfer protein-like [Folsomia candida]